MMGYRESKENVTLMSEKDAFDSDANVGVAPQVFDTKATNRLLRKMDLSLIPFLSLMYLYDSFLSFPFFKSS